MTEHRRWAGLVFVSVAVALIIVDSTIAGVAIPSIVDDLKISSTQVQWVQESYTLIFAAFLIVFGTLADRYGRRLVLLLGVAVFALSSVAAALAPTGDLLIAARLVQGLGGAAVLPTTLSLINANFRGRDRAIAFATWGSTIGGMTALGPLLGGWLTTDFSWRWAFGTGLILLALAIGSFVASGFAGAFGNRIGAVVIVRVGLAAEIVGVAGLGVVIAPDTEWGVLIPFLFVYGFGVGLATAQLTGVVLRDVPVTSSGQASGTQSTSRQIGSALGIAVLGTILFSSAAGVLGARLDDRGMPASQRDPLVSAVVDSSGAAIAGLERNPRTKVVASDAKLAFSDGTRYAAWSAAGFLSVGLLATLSLGSGRRPAGQASA